VSADLDALLVCLYVLVDDLLPARRNPDRPLLPDYLQGTKDPEHDMLPEGALA